MLVRYERSDLVSGDVLEDIETGGHLAPDPFHNLLRTPRSHGPFERRPRKINTSLGDPLAAMRCCSNSSSTRSIIPFRYSSAPQSPSNLLDLEIAEVFHHLTGDLLAKATMTIPTFCRTGSSGSSSSPCCSTSASAITFDPWYLINLGHTRHSGLIAFISIGFYCTKLQLKILYVFWIISLMLDRRDLKSRVNSPDHSTIGAIYLSGNGRMGGLRAQKLEMPVQPRDVPLPTYRGARKPPCRRCGRPHRRRQ